MRPVVLLSPFILLMTSVVRSDDAAADRAASWEPVIVLSGNAQVFAGDKPGAKIPPGTIEYVSQRNKDWLLLPRYNSWLHEQHARSLPTALAFLNEQIAKQPSGDLHHYRAIVLSEQGRLQEAIQDFDAAINLGTNASNVFLNRGLAWGRAGDRERAVADFEQAIRRDPKNSHAYFNRGVIASQDDEFSVAIRDFNRAIEIEPTYAEAHNNRGVAYEAQGERALARADYDRAIELRPRYPNALTNRAYLRQLSGDFQGAIGDYAAALRMAPDSHPTLNDLAWLLATCPDENIRNGPAALEYAERANLLTNNADADYLDTLAAAAAATGDFDRAVQSLEAALKIAEEGARTDLESRLALYREQKPFLDADMPEEETSTDAAETTTEPNP